MSDDQDNVHYLGGHGTCPFGGRACPAYQKSGAAGDCPGMVTNPSTGHASCCFVAFFSTWSSVAVRAISLIDTFSPVAMRYASRVDDDAEHGDNDNLAEARELAERTGKRLVRVSNELSRMVEVAAKEAHLELTSDEDAPADGFDDDIIVWHVSRVLDALVREVLNLRYQLGRSQSKLNTAVNESAKAAPRSTIGSKEYVCSVCGKTCSGSPPGSIDGKLACSGECFVKMVSRSFSEFDKEHPLRAPEPVANDDSNADSSSSDPGDIDHTP